MIHIEELFCRLANGTLQNTSLATEDVDIDEDGKSKVVIAINEALTRLHSRFILKESNVIVEMQEGRTNYPLLKKYAIQSYDPTEVPCPYIIDLNDEAFDLAWEKVLGYDRELQSQACQAFRYDPEAAWQAFDRGSRHTFTRDVFTRGVNRHCL